MVDGLGVEVVLGMAGKFDAERLAFKKFCDSIPKDEADRLRAERRARRDTELAHQRALEVAREGRSLNFWGNR